MRFHCTNINVLHICTLCVCVCMRACVCVRAERYCHFSITIDTATTIHDTEYFTILSHCTSITHTQTFMYFIIILNSVKTRYIKTSVTKPTSNGKSSDTKPTK